MSDSEWSRSESRAPTVPQYLYKLTVKTMDSVGYPKYNGVQVIMGHD